MKISTRIKEEHFYNKHHYMRFIWAWYECIKINKKLKKGELLYWDMPIEGKFKLNDSGEDVCIVLGNLIFCGCVWDESKGKDLIWVDTRAELKKRLKGIKIMSLRSCV